MNAATTSNSRTSPMPHRQRTAGRCGDCGRPKASDADWAALNRPDPSGEVIDCDDPACVWGGDRCWTPSGCGCPATNVVDLVERARALRRGLPLTKIPHPLHPTPVGEVRAGDGA